MIHLTEVGTCLVCLLLRQIPHFRGGAAVQVAKQSKRQRRGIVPGEQSSRRDPGRWRFPGNCKASKSPPFGVTLVVFRADEAPLMIALSLDLDSSDRGILLCLLLKPKPEAVTLPLL